MKNPKQAAIEAIESLPENASFHRIARTIEFVAAVHAGFKDIDEGRIISNEQMKERLQKFLSK